MKRVTQKPYVYWLAGIFAAYLALNVFISQFYITARYIPYYLQSIHWTELGLSVIFTLIVAGLVALNSVYGYIKYQERKHVKKTAAMTCVSTIAGLSTGVCPACVTGLFPLVLSFFGVSFTWGALPFKGLEIQALVVLILGASLYFLHKP